MSDAESKGLGFQLDNTFGTEPSPLDKAFAVADAAVPPKSRDGRRLVVGPASEIPPGSRRIVDDGRQGIGVFNVAGSFHAIKNVCPHAGAPLCRGGLHATHRPADVQRFDPALDGRVLRCPWHGWEFDVVTGKGLYDAKSRVATYPVEVDAEGNVVVTV